MKKIIFILFFVVQSAFASEPTIKEVQQYIVDNFYEIPSYSACGNIYGCFSNVEYKKAWFTSKCKLAYVRQISMATPERSIYSTEANELDFSKVENIFTTKRGGNDAIGFEGGGKFYLTVSFRSKEEAFIANKSKQYFKDIFKNESYNPKIYIEYVRNNLPDWEQFEMAIDFMHKKCKKEKKKIFQDGNSQGGSSTSRVQGGKRSIRNPQDNSIDYGDEIQTNAIISERLFNYGGYNLNEFAKSTGIYITNDTDQKMRVVIYYVSPSTKKWRLLTQIVPANYVGYLKGPKTNVIIKPYSPEIYYWAESLNGDYIYEGSNSTKVRYKGKARKFTYQIAGAKDGFFEVWLHR